MRKENRRWEIDIHLQENDVVKCRAITGGDKNAVREIDRYDCLGTGRGDAVHHSDVPAIPAPGVNDKPVGEEVRHGASVFKEHLLFLLEVAGGPPQ